MSRVEKQHYLTLKIRKLFREMAKNLAAITEGKATILVPKNEVFYNPIQQLNRDFSVAAIQAWASLSQRSRDEPWIKGMDALAATGLRACRYATEVPQVKTVIANDLIGEAVKAIARNAEHNGVSDRVTAKKGEASDTMYSVRGHPLHFIDLDPYGGAAPFADAAVQSVTDGGLLLVTCTDLGVLAGAGYPEKCLAAYGGLTTKNDAVHESALRLVLYMLCQTAARYGRSIEPLMCISVDYYVRCFVRIRNSPISVKHNMDKEMIVWCCSGCSATHLQPMGIVKANPEGHKHAHKFAYAKGPVVGPQCSYCQSPHHLAGPMWAGDLHNLDFVNEMINIVCGFDQSVYETKPRMEGILALVKQELTGTPFYVNPNSMASIVRSPVPSMKKFLNAIFNGGYKASLTHAKAGCIKTDAPPAFLWDILRAWAKENRSNRDLPDSPGARILAQPQGAEISFADAEAAAEVENFRKSKIVRFPMNPRKDWGPMAKAKAAKKTRAEGDEQDEGGSKRRKRDNPKSEA